MPTAPAKKRFVVSYDTMSQDLKDGFDRKYPHGYADYMGDILKVDKPDGSCFHAVRFKPEAEEGQEVEDVLYLVKINVNTDKVEEVEKELFEDHSDDSDVDSGDVLPGNDNDFNTPNDEDSDEE